VSNSVFYRTLQVVQRQSGRRGCNFCGGQDDQRERYLDAEEISRLKAALVEKMYRKGGKVNAPCAEPAPRLHSDMQLPASSIICLPPA
jgi:hypothetical protein